MLWHEGAGLQLPPLLRRTRHNSLLPCSAAEAPRPAPACLRRRGTDTRLPFECPADFILHIPHLDQNGVAYRVPNFLQQPQVGGPGP